jgi:hypothetical protein
VIVRGFKRFYISDKMDGKEGTEEVGNVGSELETEDGNCEDTEAES